MAIIKIREYVNKHKINVLEYIDKEKWLYYTKLFYTTQKGDYKEREFLGSIDTDDITKQKLSSYGNSKKD